jgi:hypothetical protein
VGASIYRTKPESARRLTGVSAHWAWTLGGGQVGARGRLGGRCRREGRDGPSRAGAALACYASLEARPRWTRSTSPADRSVARGGRRLAPAEAEARNERQHLRTESRIAVGDALCDQRHGARALEGRMEVVRRVLIGAVTGRAAYQRRPIQIVVPPPDHVPLRTRRRTSARAGSMTPRRRSTSGSQYT